MEPLNTFLELTSDETIAVAKICLMMDKEIINQYPTFSLPENLHEASEGLTVRFETIDYSTCHSIALNFKETLTLEHALIFTSVRLQSYFNEEFDPETASSNEEETNDMFIFLRNYIPDLLWRISKLLDYEAFGLSILKDVYSYEMKVIPKLKVDDTLKTSYILFNSENLSMIRLIFATIKTLETYQDESNFAKRIYEYEYMNIHDLRDFENKLKKARKGRKFFLTKKDSIILYWSISLIQRMFISDATGIIEFLDKIFTTEVFLKFRKSFLNYNSAFLEQMNEQWSHDQEMISYFDKVKEWEV